MITEADLLKRCLAEIEDRLNWGSSADWSGQEFEELGERILEDTGVSLSPTTLKRVWGRVNYASKPSQTTLNALAVFLGLENWRSYRLLVNDRSNPPTITSTPETVIPETAEVTDTAGTPPLRWLIASVGALLLVVLGIAAVVRPTDGNLPPDSAFTFDFQTIGNSLPNSVVFNYNAEAALRDNVYIQQSWDPKRRERVSRSGRTHTSIYYLPGYYNAKLVVDERTVKSRDLYIPSEQWVGVAERSPRPVYFERDSLLRSGTLGINTSDLRVMGIPLQPDVTTVTLAKVPVLADTLMSNYFRFRTRLRHTYGLGAAACRTGRIVILLKNDAIVLPFSAPGCIAELELYLPDRRYAGSDTDLSGFGIFREDEKWVDLSFTSTNNEMSVAVNGNEIFRDSIDAEPLEIIGLRYSFEGAGAVDEFSFTTVAGDTIWAEDFN